MANSGIDALYPEFWALETLAVLREEMVMPMLVHRDFSPLVASFGDVVNTRKPADFVGYRKNVDSDVTIQSATATNVAVPLNQHIHTTFLIKDVEASKSQFDLISMFANPAAVALARAMDQILVGQQYQFAANATTAGRLGLLTSSTAKSYIVEARKTMNVNKVPMNDRNFVISSNSESQLLQLDEFTSAEKVGDGGRALREASIGRKFGFNFYLDQNVPDITTTAGGTSTTAAAVAAGATSFDVASGTNFLAGMFIKVVGDETLQKITNVSTDTLTISPGLKRAVSSGATVTRYPLGAVNLVAGYAAGYEEGIAVDAFSVAPEVGSIVTFGTSGSAAKYSIIKSSTTEIWLDRPLEASVANDVVVATAPAGSYNFAFHRNAIALVTRPLAPITIGANSAIVTDSDTGLTIRATISYEGIKQGYLVTLDFLAGVKVLDSNLGCIVYG